MNATEIIDQTLGHDDNVDETGADNTDRRIRHLEYLREVQADLWWLTDFSWKKSRDTVVVPVDGTGKAVLPPDFDSLGNYGGIYLPVPSGAPGDGRKLDLVPESVIMDLFEADYRSDSPQICAIFEQAPFFQQYVHIPRNDSPITLAVRYQTKPPRTDEVRGLAPATDIAMTATAANTGTLTSTVTDFTTEFLRADGTSEKFVRISGFLAGVDNGEFEIVGTVTPTSMPVYKTSGDNLVAEIAGAPVTLEGHLNDIKQIPEKFHQRVVMAGMRARARESKGDARWQKSVADFETGKMAMKREEQRFQGAFRQMPSFFGRHVY